MDTGYTCDRAKRKKFKKLYFQRIGNHFVKMKWSIHLLVIGSPTKYIIKRKSQSHNYTRSIDSFSIMFFKQFLLLVLIFLSIFIDSAQSKNNPCVDDNPTVCNWVKDNMAVRCRKKRYRAYCHDTCGACPCRDRNGWKHNGWTCNKLAKEVAIRGTEFCKTVEKASSQCQATCKTNKDCNP